MKIGVNKKNNYDLNKTNKRLFNHYLPPPIQPYKRIYPHNFILYNNNYYPYLSRPIEKMTGKYFSSENNEYKLVDKRYNIDEIVKNCNNKTYKYYDVTDNKYYTSFFTRINCKNLSHYYPYIDPTYYNIIDYERILDPCNMNISINNCLSNNLNEFNNIYENNLDSINNIYIQCLDSSISRPKILSYYNITINVYTLDNEDDRKKILEDLYIQRDILEYKITLHEKDIYYTCNKNYDNNIYICADQKTIDWIKNLKIGEKYLSVSENKKLQGSHSTLNPNFNSDVSEVKYIKFTKLQNIVFKYYNLYRNMLQETKDWVKKF